MMNVKIFVLSVAAVVAMTGVAIAGDSDVDQNTKLYKEQRWQDKSTVPDRLLRRLSLTETQQATIRELVAEHRSARGEERGHGERMADTEAWQALMAAPQFDATTARELLEKRQAAHVNRQLSAMQLQHAIRQVLTDEQKQQWDSLRQKSAHERREEWRRKKPDNTAS